MAIEHEGIIGEIRAGLTRENISSRFRAFRKTLGEMPKTSVLHYSILGLTLALAGLIRLLPLRWGAYISEFDPYFNYNDMRQITGNGWQSWYSYVDFKAWYPFGRSPVITSYPGTSFTGTMFYQFLQSIGININLYDAAVWMPVILGTFGVLVIYFFAKDIWGRSAGLLAGLFAAFNSSLISRTSLGFFRNEGVGIPTMVLSFLFFLRAINPNRSLKGTIIYSFLASISLIYMEFAWGSFRYAAEVLALFTLVLVLLKRYTPRLLLSYGITIGFFNFTGTQLLLLGHSYLTESSTIAQVAVMGVLAIMQLSRLTPTARGRFTVLLLSLVATVSLAVLGVSTGIISAGVRGKFLATIDPFIRNSIPLVASVAENRPSTWASFYLEIGSIILLAVLGFFFAFQRLRDADILLIVFGITAFYFAASLVRLTLLLAPALATLAAITVVELGKPAMDIIQQTVIFPRRRLRFTTRVSREFSLGILFIILILTVPTFIFAVQSAYTPTTIASASLPLRNSYPDWLEALSWMSNLPSRDVVFAWWDYGYWISVNTGLHTLADNGTGNTTQIQIIATGLMLNESMAVNLLQRFGVTHVAIFITYNYVQGGGGLCSNTPGNPPFCGFGDDSKWYWMVRIGNGTQIQTPQGPANVTYTQITTSNPTTQQTTSEYDRLVTLNGHTDRTRITSNFGGTQVPASDTLLGLLMRNSFPTQIPSQYQPRTADTNDIGDKSVHFFTQAYQSSNNYVIVYKVNYGQNPVLTAQLNPPFIATGGSTNITGTLSDQSGNPISNANVTLQYSSNKAIWTDIGKATVSSRGSYFFTNWRPSSTTSTLYVRAFYAGDPARKFNLAISPYQPLTEH